MSLLSPSLGDLKADSQSGCPQGGGPNISRHTSKEDDNIDPNKIPPLTEEEVALAYQAGWGLCQSADAPQMVAEPRLAQLCGSPSAAF